MVSKYNKNKKQKDIHDRCKNCGSTILTIDHHGIQIKLGTQTLTLEDELRAVIDGATTWQLRKLGAEYYLNMRLPMRIKLGLRTNEHIFKQHECNKDFTLDHPEHFNLKRFTYEFPEEPQW